jgi:hypothetical protein
MTTLEIVFLFFGFLALVGIFVALTDKNLTWKRRK